MSLFDKFFRGANAEGEKIPREIVKIVKVITEGDYDAGEEAKRKLESHPEREKAIPPLIDYFRKHKDQAYKVSNALGAIGTVAAVEPLLEVFTTVPKGRTGDSGSVPDQAGTPSSNLVQLKGGLQALQERCTPDLYEEILLRAHEYGESGNSEVNHALGEIASPRAIGRLLFVLWQQQWDSDRRQSAIEALARIGRAVLPKLCTELRTTLPQDRKHQTGYRKDILKVLAISGDKSCADTVVEVANDDGRIVREARITLEAIAQRDETVSVPTDLAPRPKQIRTVQPTGDTYVDSCFAVDFEELDEERDWYEIEELRKVTELVNQGQTSEAMALLESVWGKYADFDFAYIWKAILLHKMGELDDARDAIRDGLQTAKKKYALCGQIATIEYESGSLGEAVKWWIKSIASQISIGQVDSFPPFLYLSYIAEALNDSTSSNILLAEVDKIRPGQIRLDGTGQSQVFQKVAKEGNPSIRKAIERLCRTFLA